MLYTEPVHDIKDFKFAQMFEYSQKTLYILS